MAWTNIANIKGPQGEAGPTTWAGITDKPAKIAAGATEADARSAISAGDVIGQASSVDSEVALFSGTGGKTIKRASATGIAKLSSGVLSTVTAPTGTIVGTSDTQTLTNKKLVLGVSSNSSSTSLTTATNSDGVYCFTGSSASAASLPTLSSNIGYRFLIVNIGSAMLSVSRSGSDLIWLGAEITTFYVAPGSSVEVVGGASYWLITSIGGGSVIDSQFGVVDGGDWTKKAVFQCSGIATGNTRVLTIPDSDGTIAYAADLAAKYTLPGTGIPASDLAAAVQTSLGKADSALQTVTAHNQALSTITDVTATAAEVNVLDGITATTTELNYTDGVTSAIQTQLDGKGTSNLAIGTTAGTACEGNDSRLSDARTPTSHSHAASDITSLTATAAELNVLDGITSTTAELNILDGVTATAAELNALDGITATVTELNYTDGVTSAIQTQFTNKVSGLNNATPAALTLCVMTAAQYAAAQKDASTVYIVTA